MNLTHHINFPLPHRNIWNNNILERGGLFWLTALQIPLPGQVAPLLWDSGEGRGTRGHAMTRQQREMGLTRVLQWHLRTCPHALPTFQRLAFYEIITFPSDTTRDCNLKNRGILVLVNLKP